MLKTNTNSAYLTLKNLQNTPLQELTFAIVDTETTGMSAQFGKIIDIGIVIMQNNNILTTWETLIDPQQQIPFWITHYTNLTNKDVTGKPQFATVAPHITKLLQNTIFVAHNVGFDYAFLKQEFARTNTAFDPPNLCTVKLGRKLLPQLANAHLDALSEFYNITITQRHRALPDAQATAIVFGEFMKIAQEKYYAKTFFDLERLQTLKIDKKLVFGDYKMLNLV